MSKISVIFICLEGAMMGASQIFPNIPDYLGELLFWGGIIGLFITGGLWLLEKLGFFLVNPFQKISLDRKDSNKGDIKTSKDSNYRLDDKDIEFLLNGKFVNETFVYNRSKGFYSDDEKYKGWACTVAPSIFFNLTEIGVLAPKKSFAKIRFKFRYKENDIEIKNFVIYIYSDDGNESVINGSTNDITIALSNNSTFKYRVEHTGLNKLVNLNISVLSLIITVISWKK